MTTMHAEVAGRKQQQKAMRDLLKTPRSEFLAVYGRRRIGKTYLIRKVFGQEMAFQMTGMANATMEQQLVNFFTVLRETDPTTADRPLPASWFDALGMLRRHLERLPEGKKVVFFDELPWIDSPRSGFLSALEHFWNSWASARADILLVVCGSAASWMINRLINNRGGLHNRVTARIHLFPFSLGETEHYLKFRNVSLDRYQIVQLYMVMGGVPFYLNEVRPGESAFQTIDRTCFTKDGLLAFEYGNLYASLFAHAERHEAVVRALASKSSGLTRDEILRISDLSNGGTVTKVLDDLEKSGFIVRNLPFGKKLRNAIYRLTDQYSLFYHKFIAGGRASGEGSWMNRIDSPAWRAWSGYAFENIGILHKDAIKRALGISGVHTEVSSWTAPDRSAQVDLLIDRRDHSINLCEVKFSQHRFVVTKAYKAELERKLASFRNHTETRKSVFLTMVTTFGIQENEHSIGLVQNSVTMDELFTPDIMSHL